MPLGGTGIAWGNKVATAVLALNPDSAQLTAAETALIRSIWQTIATEHASHIVSETVVLPGTFSTVDIDTGSPEPVINTGLLS